jgi:hypothetical protein
MGENTSADVGSNFSRQFGRNDLLQPSDVLKKYKKEI